ncbi:hypothetical protein L3V43_20585 [Pseudoalteromonas sp. L23]|uniref:hypothetical protein n=1 Tax=unclassified Pseudoalteromonas TaxID=194690 RepID=UPI001EF113DB|nr:MULTISPECIES: hypothetical protein [unclassified Pseudoalteromonas]MCF7515978.1 hypothetical protein [Pseudoalteromonas sp. L7]MCF7528050.1 hypothetical protein [Pseudoalteromonas sp. L23]
MFINTNNGDVALDENCLDALKEKGYSTDDATALIKAAMAKHELNTVLQQRQQAYRAEADALFLAWQYDQTPEAEQAWRDKVAEIKQRYPKPA